MKPIPRPLRAPFAALALALPAALSAAPATLVDDRFADGGFANGADTLDVAWSTAAGATLSVVSDAGSGNLDDGNALQADATSFPSTVKANFAAKTLLPGDSLTLTVRFRIYANTTADAKGLRIGLGSAAGTYGIDLATGGTYGGEWRRYNNGLSAAGSPVASLATNGSSRTINDTQPRRLEITVRRTDTAAVSLTAELFVGSDTRYVWSATDTGSLLTTFDGIALSQENGAIDVRYDGIKVVHSPRSTSWNRLGHWRFDDAEIAGEARVQSWDKSAEYQHLRLRQGATPTDLHGAAHSGVSGAVDDFVLTLPTANSHGLVQNPQAETLWQQIPAMTFCGWVKASSVPATGKYLLDWTGDERVELTFPSAGVLAMKVGGVELARTAAAVITSTEAADGTWVFLAATYTGGLSSGGVKFYKGTATSAVALVANNPTPAANAVSPVGNTTASAAIMNGSTNPGDLYLGNDSTLGQVFPGVIDDFRVYDGALGLAAGNVYEIGNNLEDIRLQGFTPKNLLLNGAFGRPALGTHAESAFGNIGSQWQFFYASGATPKQALHSSSANYLSAPRAQYLEINDAADLNPSSFPLTQGLTLRAGRLYRVGAWLKGTPGTRVRLLLAPDTSTTFGVHTATLQGSAQNNGFEEVVFYGGSAYDVNAVFAVRLIDQPSSVRIDDVSVEEIESADGVVRTVSDTPIPGSFFGVHLNKGYVNVWPQMGQKTLRLWDSQSRWCDLELTPGVWQIFAPGTPPTGGWPTEGLNYINKRVNKAYDNTPSPTIVYTSGIPPAWAAESGNPTKPPVNLSDWTNYVTQVATHTANYQNAADPLNAARPIDYWEIWNEVDSGHFYGGTMRQLVALTKTTRDTLAGLDQPTQIVSPNFTVSGLVKMEEFLRNDVVDWDNPWSLSHPGEPGQFIDVWAIHAYSFGQRPETHRPFFGAAKHLLERFGQQNKPLWNTEGSEALPNSFAGIAASGVLARKFLFQWSEGITNYDWYAWDINWGGSASALGVDPITTGELTSLGKAYREVANWLVGAKMVTKQVTRSQLGGERWVLQIERDDGYKGWIVWDTAGAYQWTPPASWSPAPNRRRLLPPRPLPTDPLAVPYAGGAIEIGQTPVLLDAGSWRVALVDFGAATSPYPSTTTGWNNVNVATGTVPLVDPYGLESDLTLSVDQPFNTSGTGGNTNGTPSPSGAAAAYVASATRDSLFGNTATFGGQTNRHPRVVISGLNPDLRYSFSYFASRTGTPSYNRSTDYVLTNGVTTDTKTLNAQDNASTVVSSAFLAPSANGTLTLDLVKDSANTTPESFTYLGVLEIRATTP